MADYSHISDHASEQRALLRQSYRQVRKNISATEQTQSALNIVKQVQLYQLLKQVKRVGIYLSNDGELDTQALITFLWQLDIDVFLPVLHPFSEGHLLFLRYTQTTPMQNNKYGILEPILDCTQIGLVHSLDIIFTPLVAFDENGNRLGMGGGFYDRTFERLSAGMQTHSVSDKFYRNSRDTCLIGLAHEAQKAESLPTQVWDIPLPYILTPSRLYCF